MLRTCLKRSFATRTSVLYRIALPLGLILAVLVVIIYRCGENCGVGSKVVVGVNVYDQASRAIKSATAAPCSADDSRRYLRNLCDSYHKDTVTGSLCKPLCDTRDIVYLNCFPGGIDKVFVVLASWDERKIVLKTTKASAAVDARLGQQSSLSVEDFRAKIATYIQGMLGFPDNSSVSDIALERIVGECDIHSDGVLTGPELQHCSRLVQPDLILSTLLKDSDAIPLAFGTCGEMVAFEYASSEPLHSGLLYRRRWWESVELAIAVLDMIHALEHTAYGALYICDMQWKNLGVVNKPGGGVVVKSIDNDKSFFEANMRERINQKRSCEVDYDCRVVGCSVTCNVTTHTCSRQLASNNLQMVCKRIFQNSHNQLLPALLTSPPSWVAPHLNSLLRQCVDSGQTSQHIPQDLADQFYLTLWQSLHSEQVTR